jgi:signal peptidase I
MTAAARVVSTSAIAALVLATVWLFWPTSLGGATTYLTTYGSSMEPEFSAGDMVVLSQADRYAVGDAVGYRSESLNTVVMHRIVAGDANGFVTQGDNNDWLDQDRPTADEILGRLFVHIPQGGKAMAALASPWTLGLVAGATTILLGVLGRGRGRHTARSRHRRRRARRAPSLTIPALSLPALSLPGFSAGAAPLAVRARARQVALAAGAGVIVAAVGAGALFLVPSTENTTEVLEVTQQGRFTYAGSAERGTTYPTGAVETGDTVWTKLSTGLTVTYANTVTGPDLADLQGAMRLDVTLQAADGWSTYLNSGPAVAFQDGTATASVDVDAARASAVLSRHYDEVGTASGSAMLVITPTAAISGTARSVPFEADGPPGFTFLLDQTSLRLTGEADTVLATSAETPVTVDAVGPRSVDVLALSVPIGVLRTVALVVLALAVLTAAGAARLGRLGRGDAADEFLVRHVDRIVPVATLSTDSTVIDVSDAESLHRVAERFDTVVLHHAGPEGDVFAVRDVDATYRFVMSGSGDRRRGKPPVPAPVAPAVAEESLAELTSPLPRVGPLRGRFA